VKARVLAACALAALLAQGAAASAPPAPDRIVLTLPRAPAATEAVWLSVRLGVLRRGARVLVLSDDGRLLGAISPFAIAPGDKAGAYTIPLPEGTVRDGRVAVRIVVEEREHVTRPSTRGEVEDVDLVYVPATR
jgi:hypothetical protein